MGEGKNLVREGEVGFEYCEEGVVEFGYGREFGEGADFNFFSSEVVYIFCEVEGYIGVLL